MRHQRRAARGKKNKKKRIEMSIVIFGMWGTSESQGLSPGRDVKRKGERGNVERGEGVCVCVCVCEGEM